MALAADGTAGDRAPRTVHVHDSSRDTEGELDYQAVLGVAASTDGRHHEASNGKVGRVYRAKLATTGGVPEKKWKITSGPLPRGIRLDRVLGVLSGTPTRPGRYRVTFEVTDTLKVKAAKKLVIEVLP
jgi:hypothetical protein